MRMKDFVYDFIAGIIPFFLTATVVAIIIC
jgi:hypothetical protein